jgi:type I restriction enzyme S subunit
VTKAKDSSSGWPWMSLEQVAGKPQYGWTTKTRLSEGIKILRTTDISSGTVNWATIPVCEIPPRNLDKFTLFPLDVLVSRAGSVGFNYMVDETCPPGTVFASYLMRLRPNRAVIDPGFLRHYFRSPIYWSQVAEGAIGIAMANLNGSKLARFRVPVPPLPVQRSIARQLDRMSDLSTTADTHLRQTRIALARFRQSILGAACSGRLTNEFRLEDRDPNEHSGLDTPPDWQRLTLGEICERITSGSRDWTPFYGRGSGTFVMAQNVRRGYLDWSFHQQVDPPLNDSASDRSRIVKGDLLVTIVGANTADVGPVTEDRPNHFVCQSVALVRPSDTRVSPFLNLWLGSELHGRAYLLECAYGEGRPHLSFEQLRRVPIAMPQPEEQVEIVRRVDHLFNAADSVTHGIDSAADTANEVLQSVMRRAFGARRDDAGGSNGTNS